MDDSAATKDSSTTNADVAVSYGVATTDHCLRQILDLQARNHADSLASPEEVAKEGYVTVKHTLDLLRRMNTPHPHVVARASVPAQQQEGDSGSEKDNVIVGYTLVLDPVLGAEIPLLDAMFERINAIELVSNNDDNPNENDPATSLLLRDRKYFVMGQVCIAKDYRGRGVFGGLYQELQTRMKAHGYEYIVTLVSRHNPRSLRAHRKVGFVTLADYEQGHEHWEIIALSLQEE